MNKLPSPFEPYQPMADKIAEWAKDWISQNEFDELAMDNPMLVAVKPDTPILALAGWCLAGEYLPVLQIMQCVGMIEAKTMNKLIYYKVKLGDAA